MHQNTFCPARLSRLSAAKTNIKTIFLLSSVLLLPQINFILGMMTPEGHCASF